MGRHAPVGQHAPQFAATHAGRRVVVGHGGDAGAGLRELDQQVRSVGHHPRRRRALPGTLAAAQGPDCRLAVAPEQAQRIVAFEILRRQRIAALGQIARRGIQAAGKHADAPCRKQCVVGQVAHAQGKVEILAEQVHAPRRKVELQRHRRMQRDEGRQHVGQQQIGEIGGHRHPQAAAGTRLTVFAQGFDGIDLRRHLARVFQQLQAELGQCEAARGTQHQALAELLFEESDAPRYGGFGQADTLGGATEAAGLGDTGEDQQVIGFVLFHIRNNVIRLMVFCSYFVINKVRITPSPTQGEPDEHPANQRQRPP